MANRVRDRKKQKARLSFMKSKKILQILLLLVMCAFVGAIGSASTEANAKDKDVVYSVVKYKSVKKAAKAFEKQYGFAGDVQMREISLYDTKVDTKFGKKKCALCIAWGSAGNFVFYFKHKGKVYRLEFGGVVHINGMSKNGKYLLASLSGHEYSLFHFSGRTWKIIASTNRCSNKWIASKKKKYAIQDIRELNLPELK